MADDISNKIQEIMQNPELMNMISSFMGSKADEGTSSSDGEAIKLQGIMQNLNSTNDRRITLLNALKPYMRNSRAANIDKAIKMIRLSKLGSILKDL